MTMEDPASNVASNRLALLAQVFAPGKKFVWHRSGERIIEGEVLRIEGRKAVVRYVHRAEEKEAEVPLEKLNELNPGLLHKQKENGQKSTAA